MDRHLIVTKSISRFGRNTATTISALNNLRICNIDVYFENEGIHSKDGQNTFIITSLEGIAQGESTNRSKNISWGILRKVESGDAQLLRRKCYGYCQNNEGNLQINPLQQQTQRNIK
jgi:site-specific DNA recombinase